MAMTPRQRLDALKAKMNALFAAGDMAAAKDMLYGIELAKAVAAVSAESYEADRAAGEEFEKRFSAGFYG